MKHYRNAHFLSILYLLLPLLTYSQVAAHRFRHISKENGLASSTVESITQDRQGFIWFGTTDGLNRYDGYQMITYRNHPDSKKSLSSNYILQLLEDTKQRFWIVTDNGLNRFDRDENRFTRYEHDPDDIKSITSNTVNCIFEDSKGVIWVGTANGLELFDASNNIFYHFPVKCNDCRNNNISCIYEDTGGNLWIGTEDGYLNLFDRKTRRFKTIHKPDAAGSGNNRITSIREDLNKNLWVGTLENGVYFRQAGEKTFLNFRHDERDKSSLSSNGIKSIVTSRKGEVWIGTENGGLNLWKAKKNTFAHFENNPYNSSSISQKTVSAIFEDVQGNLWIGTHRGGVNVYNPTAYKFELYTPSLMSGGLSYKDIKSFFEDDKGRIWIGTDGGGVNVWDRKADRFTYYRHDPDNSSSIGSDAILHMMKDRQGNMWLGTWGGGLNLYNAASGTFTRFMNDPKDLSSISSNNVWRVYQDRSGKIWVATFYCGLNLFDPKTRKFSRVMADRDNKTHFTGNNVVTILEDKQGNIWFGTDDGGLNCYDARSKRFSQFFYKKEKDVVRVAGNIRVIYSDSKGRLWVGQKGLYLYNPKSKSFSLHKSASDISRETIQGILEDKSGNLWISTSNGIIKLNPDNDNFTRFSNADGLQGLEFGQNACLKISTGEMLFGGGQGFNIFHPDSIKRNMVPPPVHLSDFQIFNKSVEPGQKDSPLQQHISTTKQITVSYDQSMLSFEFAALNYISPEKNQYAYKLDGFDKTWNYVGTQRKATYTNLDPGEYTFQVKAANNDGVWNSAGSQVKLIVKPPYWMTWWFRTCLITGTLLCVYFGLRFKRGLELKALEEKKREDMHQVQLQLFTNISHEFRTPLSLIMGPLEKLLNEDSRSAFSHYYKLMYRNAHRLTGLISELMDFRKVESGALKLRAAPGDISYFLQQITEEFTELASQKNITFHTDFSISKPVWFDQHIVEKILLNLLNNSFKYTAAGGEISVDIFHSFENFKPSFDNELLIGHDYKAKNYIYLRVADNGIGISKDSIGHLFERYYRITEAHLGSGVGLAFVKSLTYLHKGEIYVYSEKFKGTEFIIALPADKEDYLDENDKVATEGGVRLESTVYQYANDYFIPEIDQPVPGRKPPGKRHILIVDDNVELRTFIRESLEKFYSVSEADNGKIGLHLAREQSPDLVISDVMMPEMDGITLCRTIKEDIETSHIPFILLTAKDALESRLEGVGSGADFYFGKPLSMGLLLLTIKNIFNNREKIKERYVKDYRVEVKELVHTAKDKEFMDKILRVIDKQLENPDLNVDVLCKEIGMSPNTLYKKIKEITGQNVVEFVRNLRLKKAVQLLTDEECPINEVMYRVGIQSQSYFTSIFKKEYGKTPSQFLKELKETRTIGKEATQTRLR